MKRDPHRFRRWHTLRKVRKIKCRVKDPKSLPSALYRIELICRPDSENTVCVAFPGRLIIKK